MEQSKVVNIKSLREKFQNEPLVFRTKPAIPVKPQIIPSPTTKISNPLIASLNSAIRSPTHLAPRVVFKDGIKNQPETPLKKMQPQFLDNNQKKEGDLIKEALKGKKSVVQPKSPITPVLEETSRPEPNKTYKSMVKDSTPIKRTIFNFSKPDEKERTESSEWNVPATPRFNNYDPSTSTPSANLPVNLPGAPKAPVPAVQVERIIPFADHTVNQPVSSKAPVPPFQVERTIPFADHTVNQPVSSKVHVPPVQMEPRMQYEAPTVNQPVATRPIPAVRVNSISSRTGPVSKIQTVPESGITSPVGRVSKPDVTILPTSNFTVPRSNNYLDRLQEKQMPPSEMLGFFEGYIPPPIIPEDFTDSISPGLNTTPNVTPDPYISVPYPSVTPAFRSPALSYTDSPTLPTYIYKQPEPSVTPDSSLHPGVNTFFTYSPLPTPSATDVAPENKFTEYPKAVEQTEKIKPPPSPALSALARAEEMNPAKPRDNRLLTLLEKAKRKAEGTPESMTLLDKDLPVRDAFEFLPPKTADAEPFLPLEDPKLPESFVDPPAIPPFDYKEEEHYKTPTALFSGQNHANTLPVPKTVPIQRPFTPPPPPPKVPRAAMPDTDLTTDNYKSPLKHTTMLTPILPTPPLKNNDFVIPAPEDFNFDDSKSENTTFWDSQAETPEYGSPEMSVYEEELPEQSVPEHYYPNVDSADSRLPSAMAARLPRSVTDSPVSQVSSSPAGKQEMNHTSPGPDDLLSQKKSKLHKKLKGKGSPLNPYSDDRSVGPEEIPRKNLFSKKLSVSDENDLKTKEKQKQKEKKTLKEKEKKEQKEKKKEKEKELKEREKEKKELKEKEKEKEKELKEKEKEKEKELKEKEKEMEKELKEKEKDKKEIKEKERGKKEQKEKEKKENELKKKFKITGDEEVMYQAEVIESCKGRKDDLAVKSGEVLDIIRTTDCPKGKWLARDCTKTYGYIPVENLKLDIQEMLVMGKKAKSTNKINNVGITDTEITDGRSPNHFTYQESFEDDSEEWAEDDDTQLHPTIDTELPAFSAAARSVPVPGHQSQTNVHDNVQAKHEALQKLTTFFAQPKMPSPSNGRINTATKPVHTMEPVSLPQIDADFQILPPPDLYADIIMG